MERGLRAYRSNGQALAHRSLAAVYPAVAELIGAESFEALARHFWHRCPPERGDLAQWGGALAGFIGALPDLAGAEPYLADVARTEWALHCAVTAADSQADPASFGLLTAHDPAAITLVLGPGVACIDSHYPVASIVNAHLGGELSPEAAERLLQVGVPECALVWRQGFQPRLRLAHPGEALCIAALQQNRCLLDALAAAAPAFDFHSWLTPAALSGLVTGVRAL